MICKLSCPRLFSSALSNSFDMSYCTVLNGGLKGFGSKMLPSREAAVVHRQIPVDARSNGSDGDGDEKGPNRLRVACAPCCASKIRCDRARPCSNCVRKRIEHRCVDRAMKTEKPLLRLRGAWSRWRWERVVIVMVMAFWL